MHRRETPGWVRGTFVAARDVRQLVGVPRPVRRFYVRALATAIRFRDWRTLHSSAPPRDVALLIELTAGACSTGASPRR
jgi:hypothetical protein